MELNLSTIEPQAALFPESHRQRLRSAKDSSPKIFSFFSGAGFLDLGFEAAGFEVVFANEVHQAFAYAYQYSRERMNSPAPSLGVMVGDIARCLSGPEKRLLEHSIGAYKVSGNLVGFIGGPPCPDFSVAGKNRGETGENGKLTQTYVDLICSLKPSFFVFENVKGLYRTKQHREFFERIKAQLVRAGYKTFERLINALDYGAPQDRERIILFGVLSEECNCVEMEPNWGKFVSHVEAKSCPWPSSDAPNKRRRPPLGIPLELTVHHWFLKNAVDRHPNGKHHFIPRAGYEKFLTVHEGDDSRKSYKRLHRYRYSPTAAYGNNEVHIHPYLPRRISAAEAMAIQSLPREFELPPDMTLSDMFKTIGNGVPYLAALGIAKMVHGYLVAPGK
jgi:DNA (cytosine-5)-methyltransferase 1